MKFFTSRYTASLEQQVADLKADKARLQQEIDTLLRERKESFARTGAPEIAATLKTDKPPKPQFGNWLHTRSALESPDKIVQEVPPDKEKSANGTR